MTIFRSKRQQYIVEAIPDDVWVLLDNEECELLFLIEDRLTGRFDNSVFRERLEQKRQLRRARIPTDIRFGVS